MAEKINRCPKCSGYMAYRVQVTSGRNKQFLRVLRCLKCGHTQKVPDEDRGV